MKKLLLLFFLMTISLGYSQTTLTGTWKMSPQAGAFLVGPAQGSSQWFQNSALDVTARACFFDDQFVFNADGSFQNVNGAQTWVEPWQGGGAEGCRASVAPHDGSNPATYNYNSGAGTLTLNGVGAYLGLAKAYNGGELTSPAAAPASITYIVTSLASNLLTLDINVGGGNWWRFILAKEGSLPTCSDGIQNGTETGVDCGGTCPVCPDPTPPAPIPTIAAANAITIYSDSGNLVGTAVPVDTFRTGWSSANLDNVNLSGNAALKYTSLGFVGIETVANQINATGMNLFHIDVYTATATNFSVKLVDFGANAVFQGGDDVEHQVNLTTQVGWNSYNLLLSDFIGLTTRAHIAQIILVGNGTAYVDNMYFGNAVVQVAPVLSNFTIPTKTINDDPFTISAPQSTNTAGGFTYSSSDINVASIVGSEITIEGIGTCTITATQAASGNYLAGSISTSFTVTPAIQLVPTAGLTPPARNAWDVKSLFSGAPYTNEPSVIFDVFAVGGPGATSIEDFTLADGNVVAKYLGHRYSGIRAGAGDLNVSSMTKLHLDVYSPDPSFVTSFRIKLEAVNGSNVELNAPASPTRTNGNWISYDIDLSTYAGVDLTHLKWVVPVSTATWPVGITMYIDNVYFWRPATSQPSPTITNFTVPSKFIGDVPFQLTAPASDSTGAFTYTVTGAPGVATISGDIVTIVGGGSTVITATQAATGSFGPGSITASFVVSFPPPATAAPTPTLPADRVLSIFSDAYTNEGGASYPLWGQGGSWIQPVVVPIGTPGNNTLKVDNLTYQGVQLASNIDVSAMTTLHVDIWTPNCTTFEFYLIDSAPVGVPPLEQAVSVSLTQNGWNTIDIPMSSYNTLALTGVQQFKLVGTPAGSVVYIDNIYFTKPTSRAIAPTTTAVFNYCKGAVALPLTASGFGGALKWYTVGGTTALPTYTLIAAGAPTPVTTTVGTKKYAVSQVLSDLTESPKAIITVNTLALPTEVLGTITSNTASTTTTTGFAVATLAVGQFVGTTTPVSYRIPEFSVSGLTYVWTVPAGVNIVSGQGTNILTVNFQGVSSGIGAVGSITVQAENASGCRTAAKSIALTKVLPTAPTAIKMYDPLLPNSLTTGLPVAVTSFAQYMGTTKVLRLEAAPSATATSYVWELPTGVNQLSGGTSNVITVNFAGVTSEDTHSYTTLTGVLTNVLRIGVKSRNGVGDSVTSNATLVDPLTTSTARLLTLKSVAPKAPTLRLTNDAVPAIPATETTLAIPSPAVTDISKFVGTTATFTLTASVVANASSYEWILPVGVTVLSGNVLTDRVLQVNFSGVNAADYAAGLVAGTGTLYFQCRAVNGLGSSNSLSSNLTALAPFNTSTYKLLKVTAKLPGTVSSVGGQITNLLCGTTYSYSMTPSVLANSYVITGPTGSVITSANFPSNTTNSIATTETQFSIQYPSGFVVTSTTPAAGKTISVTSVNGVGNSLVKTFNLTTQALAAVGVNTNSYVSPTTGLGSLTLFGKCATQTISVPAVIGATSYVWTLQNGATGTSTTNSIDVDFSMVSPLVAGVKNVITVRATNGCVFSATKSITLTWDGINTCPVAPKMAKPTTATTVSIYPNPASDNFNVEVTTSEVSEMEMTIVNINGAVVGSKNLQLTVGNNVINENVSSLSSGIYFVRFYNATNNETIVKKLVKN
jgi:hypothetical protein